MDIHVNNRTNKSWEVVYVIKRSDSCSVNIVSKIVLFCFVESGTNRKNVVCCAVE